MISSTYDPPVIVNRRGGKSTTKENIMPKIKTPLFRDPIYDAPTDPTVIYNEKEQLWYMFYTQRRAVEPIIGVAWVHGTKIGVAVSKDLCSWMYRGALEGLDIEPGHNTFWAPEVIYHDGVYHMYVSYIQGIPENWQYPRDMLHYTSEDLWHWTFDKEIDLNSERVIDACVYEIEPGTWKMWFKEENDNSFTHAAVSNDLYNWTEIGREITDCAQEGPNVFELDGIKWMISDFWSGLAVYKSEDFTHWTRCKNILDKSGSLPTDQGLGHHADVVVKDGRAFIFYFCHPYSHEVLTEEEREKLSPAARCKAVVQCRELKVVDGELVCDRDVEPEV